MAAARPFVVSDPYEVLGVRPGDDQRTIERAYYRLSRRYHPDVCREPDAGAKMREINVAYAVLRDARRRATHDRVRAPEWPSAVKWEAARRAWRETARPPEPPRASASGPRRPAGFEQLRVTPAGINFGFLRRGEVAARTLTVASRDGKALNARVLTRGDWLQVDRSALQEPEASITVTADPRELAAFWEGAGSQIAPLDGWLEIVRGDVSLRIPAGAMLRRDAAVAPWWNPFARKVG